MVHTQNKGNHGTCVSVGITGLVVSKDNHDRPVNKGSPGMCVSKENQCTRVSYGNPSLSMDTVLRILLGKAYHFK